MPEGSFRSFFDTSDSVILGIIGAAGMILALFFMTFKTRLGSWKLSNNTADEEPASLLLRLQTKKSLIPLGGVVVINVPNEKWRSAVLSILSKAELTIIDVNDLTESLKWELIAALKCLPPERYSGSQYCCPDSSRRPGAKHFQQGHRSHRC